MLADKYRVEAVIGRGGMAVVVAAIHRDLGQRVAIKLMDESALHNREAVARFLREAQTASMLRSDHAVRILDVGRLKKTAAPYIVMEYLAGTDLAKIAESRGQLPFAEVTDWILEACEAVAEAHRLGIVHRDLKPSNLFLATRPDGTSCVKVLDFGISKVDAWATGGGSALSLTSTMQAMGTPVYMAPEQVRNAKSADARTDIWGLGVVLYELLAGRPPFWADTLPAISAKIVSEPAEPLRSLRAGLPPAYEALVSDCLEKDPAHRPQTILDLACLLEPFATPAGRESVGKIERIAASPQGAFTAQPIAVPSLDEADPQTAWARTRLRRRMRNGLIGVGVGIAAGVGAAAVWAMSARPLDSSRQAPSAAARGSDSAASETVPERPAADSGAMVNFVASTETEGPTEESGELPDAGSAGTGTDGSAAKAAGGRRRDPLDDRY